MYALWHSGNRATQSQVDWPERANVSKMVDLSRTLRLFRSSQQGSENVPRCLRPDMSSATTFTLQTVIILEPRIEALDNLPRL